MKTKIFAVLSVIVFLGAACATMSPAPRPSQTIPFSFDKGNGGLEISASGYKYTRGNFSFFLPDPKQRFDFFVRELVEGGQQKPSFGRWLNAEIVRITDKNNYANISLFLFDKNKIKAEKVAENNLKWYVEGWVYTVLKKTDSETRICGDRIAAKRILNLDINNNRRRLVQGWFDIGPDTGVLFSISNYGTYSDEPLAVLESIFSSLSLT